jgi:hypothetical protein
MTLSSITGYALIIRIRHYFLNEIIELKGKKYKALENIFDRGKLTEQAVSGLWACCF